MIGKALRFGENILLRWRKESMRRAKNRPSARRFTRTLTCEPLECRRLLAIDVVVGMKFFNTQADALANPPVAANEVPSLQVGKQYYLGVSAQDARSNPTAPAGLFSAYFDIAYTTGVGTFGTSFSHGAYFAGDSSNGTVSSSSILDAGGTDVNSVEPSPRDPYAVFALPFTVSSAGSGSFGLTGNVVQGANSSQDTVLFWDSLSPVPLSDIQFIGPGPSGGAIAVVANQAPAITSANTAAFRVGTPGNFSVTTTGFPNSTLSESGTLPSGLTFTNNGDGTATLAGTPAAGSRGHVSPDRHGQQRRLAQRHAELHAHRRTGPGDHQRRQHNLQGWHVGQLRRDDHGLPEFHPQRKRRAARRRDLHQQRQRHGNLGRHSRGRQRRCVSHFHHGQQRRLCPMPRRASCSP